MDAVKRYYDTATEYRKSLKTAWDEYQKGYERLQGFKGSERYDKELADLQDKRDAAIRAARDKASGSFDRTIKYMRKAIDAQPATAPTEEQMRVVNALKMRDHVERDELVKAAEQMRGVDMAVKILDEIGQQNGYHNLVGEYMGATGRASMAVDRLAGDANLMLTLTRPDGLQKRHEAHNVMKWGGNWDERHEGISIQPADRSHSYALSHVDRDFSNEREMMHAYADVGGDYSEFRSTVNYDPFAKEGWQRAHGEI